MLHHFLTFGKGNEFIDAAYRLCDEAYVTNIFDHIHVYTDSDLTEMEHFWNTHGKFLESNPKGYGYWIWKPYLIWKHLLNMNDGDVLLYADSGCEFDNHCEQPKEAYMEMIPSLIIHKIIASYSGFDNRMTKQDLITYLDMNKHPELETEQRQATSILFYNDEKTRSFAKQWYTTCCNYHLISDSPSVIPNKECYLEHRHEQAIFSLLTKKLNMYAKYETIEKCICLSRNRSGKSRKAPRVMGSGFFYPYGEHLFNENQIFHMAKTVKLHSPKHIFEIGFGSGRSAATIVQSLLYHKHPIKTFVSCDVRIGGGQAMGYALFFKAMLKRTFTIDIIEASSNFLFQRSYLHRTFPDGIDWATIDGDSSYDGMRLDLYTVFIHLNNGGVIYVINASRNEDIIRACNEFYQQKRNNLMKNESVIDENTTVFWFIKHI